MLFRSYNYINEENTFIYYGYQNIDYLLENTSSLDKIRFNVEHNLKNDNQANYGLTLSFYNKTINNEYFIITHSEIKQHAPQNLVDYYFPNASSSSSVGVGAKIVLEKEFNFINSKFNLELINRQIYQNDILSVQKCFCRNIIFDSLSNRINKDNIRYNLENLYNNINTIYLLPVIKYFHNGEFKYIKINKKFLQNHDYLEINKLLIASNSIKAYNKFLIPDLDYLQFKWRLSKTIIISVNFYENGYSTIFFDDMENLKIGSTLLN